MCRLRMLQRSSPGGYASTMYLSPRRALSSLLTGLRRRGEGAGSIVTGSSRTRIGSGMTPGTGEPVGSLVGLACMSATFQSPIAADGVGLLLGGTALPSLGTKLSVKIAVRRAAGGLCAKSLRRSGEIALLTTIVVHSGQPGAGRASRAGGDRPAHARRARGSPRQRHAPDRMPA